MLTIKENPTTLTFTDFKAIINLYGDEPGFDGDTEFGIASRFRLQT